MRSESEPASRMEETEAVGSDHEQMVLLKKLKRYQRNNAALQAELEAAKKRLAVLRYERNFLLDRVYEREVATLEISSASSDIDDDDDQLLKPPAKRPAKPSAPSAATQFVNFEPPFSEKKPKRVIKSAEAAAALPRRTQSVPMDEHGQPVLPLNFGVTTLHSLGRIVHDRPGFHNKRYIWPVGFRSSRQYLSTTDPKRSATYTSIIVDGGSGPIFQVAADDQPESAPPFSAPTSTGVWSTIVKQANSIRGRDYANSASGPDFFGLSNSTIAMLIEQLPDADKCILYQRKTFESTRKGTREGADESEELDIADEPHEMDPVLTASSLLQLGRK